MRARMMAAVGVAAVLLAAGGVMADVFNMGGTRNPDGTWTGLASLETVPVGNPGNPGELSGKGAGGDGPDAIVGGVNYDYRMGRFEVTAAQYAEFLNAVAGVDVYSLYNPSMGSAGNANIERYAGNGITDDPWLYRARETGANRPVTHVSWGDAARFANWLTNGQPSGPQNLLTTEAGSYWLNGAMTDARLATVTRIADEDRVPGKAYYVIPTEDEWYKAAYHKNDGPTSNYFDYPTSNDSLPGNQIVDPDPGNSATFWYADHTIGSPYYRTEVGEHENSASPYGTFDQGGNLSEWNETLHTASFYGVRGGSWGFSAKWLEAANRYNNGSPTGEYNGAGFRIAVIPEPASLALLVIGAAGMLLRRRGGRGRVKPFGVA